MVFLELHLPFSTPFFDEGYAIGEGNHPIVPRGAMVVMGLLTQLSSSGAMASTKVIVRSNMSVLLALPINGLITTHQQPTIYQCGQFPAS